MEAQRYTTLSLPLEDDWSHAAQPGQLVQALKTLITELIGWGGDDLETDLPPAQ